MSSKFKILGNKIIHNGFFKMKKITLKYQKYDGNWSNEIKRELFGGAQVSAVLPYDPINKKIVLIQQFRPGTISRNGDNYLDEIVAGIIDKGETPEETAIRECLEETGCKTKNLRAIQGYFPAPGSSESFYHLFLGEVVAPNKEIIKGLENENEDILVKSYSFKEVKKKMENNEILNGLTLIALQWFFLNIYKS
ncbi:NUDIX domain-containing protein [Pelagibacteraceae bacterium]|nr:NUDIX domain-containing protein [Pelagibacteraceae bacterium]